MLRRILLSITTAMMLLPMQFQAYAQRVDYDRQDCISRGGTYRFPNCIEPRSNQNTESNLPIGHIFSRNYGACQYDLLIAYVPQGQNSYKVEGWWKVLPRSYFHLLTRDTVVVHNHNYPLYYYALKLNGQSIRNLSKDRAFVFARKSYDMTAQDTGLFQGKYWIEIVC